MKKMWNATPDFDTTIRQTLLAIDWTQKPIFDDYHGKVVPEDFEDVDYEEEPLVLDIKSATFDRIIDGEKTKHKQLIKESEEEEIARSFHFVISPQRLLSINSLIFSLGSLWPRRNMSLVMAHSGVLSYPLTTPASIRGRLVS